ncbi:hypothetical protein HPB50_004187 [Hyalomma asiaticum]|uniref:Uncharacterized protein n=1 Tax=Hyalomma asiaticum TaxID=266040 RepID=A0ACB7S2Q4_HYAAI|nr:hypothetical protein HPB50_004187 [Hyalomma asiaticum]
MPQLRRCARGKPASITASQNASYAVGTTSPEIANASVVSRFHTWYAGEDAGNKSKKHNFVKTRQPPSRSRNAVTNSGRSRSASKGRSSSRGRPPTRSGTTNRAPSRARSRSQSRMRPAAVPQHQQPNNGTWASTVEGVTEHKRQAPSRAHLHRQHHAYNKRSTTHTNAKALECDIDTTQDDEMAPSDQEAPPANTDCGLTKLNDKIEMLANTLASFIQTFKG